MLRAAPDKDESDMELAVLEAVRRGATRITVLGALGGPRVDHALANVWLLAHPGLAGVEVTLLDAAVARHAGQRPRRRRRPGDAVSCPARAVSSCRCCPWAAT